VQNALNAAVRIPTSKTVFGIVMIAEKNGNVKLVIEFWIGKGFPRRRKVC